MNRRTLLSALLAVLLPVLAGAQSTLIQNPKLSGTADFSGVTSATGTGTLGGPLYVSVHHAILSSGAKLAVGRSRDGINFRKVGLVHPYIPPAPATGLRDPSIIYHAETGFFVIAYTKTISGGTGYSATLGLAKSRDLIAWEHVGDITIAGTGETIGIVWNGAWVVDDGRYYLTCLPMTAAADKNTIGAGWMECTDPGTWSTWTNFTAFADGNANFSAAHDLNDITIRKIGATYHFFCDGYATAGTGDGGMLHATSSSLWTGYSAPAVLDEHDGLVEGPIIAERPDGGWRVYSQSTFGPVRYSDAATSAFATMGTPAEIEWPYRYALGNGDVLKVDSLDAQAAVLAAPDQSLDTYDDSNANITGILTLPLDELILRAGGVGGNGDDGTGITIGSLANTPVINLDVPIDTMRLVTKLTMGANVNAQSFLVYDQGVTKYGFGIQSFELRAFSAFDNSHISFGYIDTDGTTFIERWRMDQATGRFEIASPTVPASASAAGRAGQIAWDSSYIYICVGTDTWKRAAISTW